MSRILLIEDNADHAALLSRYVSQFKGLAATVKHVSSLSAANRQLAAQAFDLIFLDLRLSDADRERTLRDLSAMAAASAVIVLTAEDNLEVAMQAVQQGAQDYLVKANITPDLLERTVRYAVQRKAGEIALKELNESLERQIAKRTATLNLLHDVASLANRGEEPEETLRVVLRRLLEEPRWSFGQFWMPGITDGSLIATDCEAAAQPAGCNGIRDESASVRLPARASLAEQAARAGSAQYIADLLKSPESELRQAATSLGIRATIAFPIVVHAETAAVLELFSEVPLEEPRAVIDTLSHIATHLRHVVERRHASRTLRESEERFRFLVNAVEEYAIITLDTDGYVVSWNAGARRITGYRARDILGHHFSCFNTDEDIAAELPSRHLAAAARRGRVAIEAQRVRADGERFPAEVVITALRDEAGDLRGFAKVTHDATQRKRLEREIADAAAAEQQRIGQDLHDGLGQELTGLTYQAESLRRQLERASSPHVATAAALVDGIREALGQVRLLSRGLMPVEVDAHGLQASLEELTEHVQELHGITCRFVCQEPVPVENNNTATQLYRIVQESLTNAVRHAAPTRITVELSARATELKVTVVDDGCGFDTSGSSSGSGLKIMRYRAGLINVHLNLDSTPGKGTRVACVLKIRKNGQGSRVPTPDTSDSAAP